MVSNPSLSDELRPLVWCDNKNAAALAANPLFHALSKHIDIDLHFILDKVLYKTLSKYIPSSGQVANIFTKHLPSLQFSTFYIKLSIVRCPITEQHNITRSSNWTSTLATTRTDYQKQQPHLKTCNNMNRLLLSRTAKATTAVRRICIYIYIYM